MASTARRHAHADEDRRAEDAAAHHNGQLMPGVPVVDGKGRVEENARTAAARGEEDEEEEGEEDEEEEGEEEEDVPVPIFVVSQPVTF